MIPVFLAGVLVGAMAVLIIKEIRQVRRRPARAILGRVVDGSGRNKMVAISLDGPATVLHLEDKHD